MLTDSKILLFSKIDQVVFVLCLKNHETSIIHHTFVVSFEDNLFHFPDSKLFCVQSLCEDRVRLAYLSYEQPSAFKEKTINNAF